jgi:hypothetical protein
VNTVVNLNLGEKSAFVSRSWQFENGFVNIFVSLFTGINGICL